MPAASSRLLELAQLEGLRSLAIIGLSKNAGKTTCLNHLIRAWHESSQPRPLGLTSIGRDGEEEDVVGGHAKPRIYIKAGSYLATARSALSRSDALLEIRALSGVRTAFGEIVICKALSDGFIELAGPSNAEDLRSCEALLRAEDPEVFFVVDGALSRRSQAGGGLSEGLILAVGAETSLIPEELAQKTAHAIDLLQIPAADASLAAAIQNRFREDPSLRALAFDPKGELARELRLPSLFGAQEELADFLKEGPAVLALRGAISDSVLRGLLASKDFKDLSLIVEDGTRLFLTKDSLERLKMRKVKLEALYPLRLQLLCLNPFKADGSAGDQEAMLAKLREISPVPVADFGPGLL